MDTKQKSLVVDADGFYVLPEPKLERREIFPGHTIILSQEDQVERQAIQDQYERIVSTTAYAVEPIASSDAAANAPVASASAWFSELFKRR